MTVLIPDQIVTSSDGADAKAFRILHPLGEGYTSRVYLAESHPGGQPRVALKALKPDLPEAFVQSFVDEADILSDLRLAERTIGDGLSLIPGVVCRATDSKRPVRFLAMELVEGKSVLDMLKDGPLQETMVLTIGDQVLRVLHLLHTRLRRSYTDFQLRNIWWQSGKGQIKLMDWNSVSKTAPEGQLPPAAGDDLVRLGAYLYQLATGKGAMQTGETAGTLAARAGDRWEAISFGTRALIAQALHPNPARRFATAAEFRAAIQAQQALWSQDEDDLHDDAFDAMRAVRSEESQRDPALVHRAETLVDMLHHRHPTDLTGKWKNDLQQMTESVSAVWGSGGQYYRAGLYSDVLKLWPDEAATWGRPDLWRWVSLARQGAADERSYEQHRPAYEDVLELLDGQHWAEAESRLRALPGGPSDDLRREVRIHQSISDAEHAEHADRWSEAETAYRNAASSLAEINEEGYRDTLREQYGWDDLDKRGDSARLRSQQMATDQATVAKLRDASLPFVDFRDGALAGLRANPTNLGLLDLLAERAVDEKLSIKERRELALLGLQFGNPPPAVESRLGEALTAAELALDAIEKERIDAQRAEARKQQQAEAEKQRREAEQKKLAEAYAAGDYNALRNSAAVVGADLPTDIRNGLIGQFKEAVARGEPAHAALLLDILYSTDEAGHATRVKTLQSRLESDFKNAIKKKEFDRAEETLRLLRQSDPDGYTRLVEELERARSRDEAAEREARDDVMVAAMSVSTLVGQGKAARDRSEWVKARDDARAALEKLEGMLKENDRADLLSSGTLDALRRGVTEVAGRSLPASTKKGPAVDASSGAAAGPPKGPAGGASSTPSLNEEQEVDSEAEQSSVRDRAIAWLRRWGLTLVLAVLMFGAGVLTASLLDNDGDDDQNIVIIQTAVAQTMTAQTVAELPEPSETPTPPPSPSPTASPTTEPSETPTPTETATATTLPPVDLGLGGALQNPDGTTIFFDIPDLPLTAPEGWRFNWSGTDVQLVEPGDAVVWTLHYAGTEPGGVAIPVPSAIVAPNPSPDATPTPEGAAAATEGTAIRLEWARQPDSAPLPAGEYNIAFSLLGPDDTERIVAPLPTVRVEPAPKITVAQTVNNAEGTPEPGRVRELPIWNYYCELTQAPNVVGQELEVVGKVTVSQVGYIADRYNPRPDAIFYLVREEGKRQTYWLPDSEAFGGPPNPSLEVPWVSAPAASVCDPTN